MNARTGRREAMRILLRAEQINMTIRTLHQEIDAYLAWVSDPSVSLAALERTQTLLREISTLAEEAFERQPGFYSAEIIRHERERWSA